MKNGIEGVAFVGATVPYFPDVEFDAVLVPEPPHQEHGLVVLEVALGGDGDDFKSGPERKMLADGFKLASAQVFLKKNWNKNLETYLACSRCRYSKEFACRLGISAPQY